MKILIIYRDLLETGGVPTEIRKFINALSEYCEVIALTKYGPIKWVCSNKIAVYSYSNIVDLYRRIKDLLCETRPKVILCVGYYQLDNIIVSWYGRINGIPIILNPVNQINTWLLNHDAFNRNPDTRALEMPNKKVNDTRKHITNRILKNIYNITVGRVFLNMCKYIAVFSNEEEMQIRKHTGGISKTYMRLLWGVDGETINEDMDDYYKNERANGNKAQYLYWGRIDWEMKGIDRIVSGVKVLRGRYNDLPFVIYLMGPDYEGGTIKMDSVLRKNNLQNDIIVRKPGEYIPGSKRPLRDADVSILLSKWDGFPRSLRESCQYGVPIIVSPETHFGDLVQQYCAGICVDEPDDPEAVANALMLMSDLQIRNNMRDGCRELAKSLSYEKLAKEFTKQIEEVIFHDT